MIPALKTSSSYEARWRNIISAPGSCQLHSSVHSDVPGPCMYIEDAIKLAFLTAFINLPDLSEMTALPSTMKALQFNPASMAATLEQSLHLNTSAPIPIPGKDQLLIKVHSAALNPFDHKIAEAPIINRFIFSSGPATPGLDFAGEIASIGPSSPGTTTTTITTITDKLKVGQRVFGRLSRPMTNGTLAEYTIPDRDGIALLPEGIGFDEAAAIGTVGQMAYQCIAPNMHADSSEAVFIHGGSGGCGAMGIQIAKALGCHVTTTCSTRNVAYCKELGADEVIDYEAQDVVTALCKLGEHRRYSLIVDNVGASGDLYPLCHRFTTPEAKYVQVGGSPSVGLLWAVSKAMLLPGFLGGGQRKYQFLGLRNRPEDLRQLGQWVKEGKVKMQIGKVYELEDGAKAYEQLKSGKTRGKIVVKLSA